MVSRFLFEPQAVQLVARSDGNNLEMEKDWEMMSEFDKDELIRKKIIRELWKLSEFAWDIANHRTNKKR